ncbi:MAG: TerC/Alx family metal homeostasis membrane protein [Planctomycetota bacterium]
MPVHWWHWLSFGLLVVVLLVLDLCVFHRHDHRPSLRESAVFTAFWIAVGLAFNALVWWWGYGPEHRSEVGVTFLNAYLIEKSLSMDNIFVFVVIFRFFHVPLRYQYRVLFWGILGAIVMRLLFILMGVALIQMFEPVIVVFGAFLVYVAYRLARHSGADVHPEKNIVLKTARRFLPVTQSDHRQHGHRFFVRQNGSLYITPMFLVLLVIESTDVLFAVDSVPAVIGIIPKTETFTPSLTMFIAFTSNVFAILGLRALYFLLAGVVDMFRYLHYGLAAVLGFVGLKMIGEYLFKEFGGSLIDGLGGYLSEPVAEYLRHLADRAEEGHLLPPWASLLVIALLLGVSIAASLIVKYREGPQDESTADDATADSE